MQNASTQKIPNAPISHASKTVENILSIINKTLSQSSFQRSIFLSMGINTLPSQQYFQTVSLKLGIVKKSSLHQTSTGIITR